MELRVHISKILPLMSGISKAGKEWKKQEYVGETVEEEPKTVVFSLFGKYIDDQQVRDGATYIVHFDIESRSFVGRDGIERWSTELRAYNFVWQSYDSVEAAANAQKQPAPSEVQNPAPVGQFQAPVAQPEQQPVPSEPIDDLPF